MGRVGMRILAPSGLLAFVLFQLSAPTFLHPAPGESFEEYGRAFLDQRATITQGAFFALLGGLLLVTFSAALAGALKREDKPKTPLVSIAFGSGLVAAAFFTLGRGLLPLLAIQTAVVDESRMLAAIEEMVWITEVFVVPFFFISLFGATALLIFRSPGLAKWIRWPAVALGALAFLMLVLLGVGISISPNTFGDYLSGEEAQTFPQGLAGGVVAPFAFLVWTLTGAASMIQGDTKHSYTP